MTKQKITYLLSLTLLLSTLSFSQVSSRTTIVENVNATKAGLVHVLNRTGDTIILKSSKEIYRFSILYHTQKESVLMDLGSKEAKIPLHHFEIGRYSVVAYREDAVYPISMNRISVISKPKDATADLEESILRSSLPEEELYKRNLKPRPKRNSDTRVAKVAPKPDNSRALAAAKQREEKARKKTEAAERAKKDLVQAEAKRAKKESALAEAKVLEAKEKKQRELAKAEANRVSKKQKALAEVEAKEREAKDKKTRELAQVEANRARIKQKAIADAKANEAIKERARLKTEKEKRDAERAENSITYAKADKINDKKEIAVKEVKYNISDIHNKSLLKQTREDYRKENLRPNGTKYEEAAIEEDKKAKK